MINGIVKYVLGKVRLLGNTDGTAIGNVSDRLKTDAQTPGVVIATSSTTTPLSGGATFTGAWEDALSYLAITSIAYSNVASADDGWKIQWSSDGTNVDHEKKFTFTKLTSGQHLTIGPIARYFRVVFINGASAQAAFRLQTIGHRGKAKNPTHTLVHEADDEDDAEIIKSVITGRTTTGDYVNVAVDENGNLQTSGNVDLLSPLPGFVARSNKVLAAGASQLTSYTMVADIALIDFHFGGKGIGQASVLRIVPATTEQVPGGGFNSSGNVALWTNTSLTALTAPSPDYSTVQAYEGTGSLRQIFTQSANGSNPQMDYTWGTVTPKDCSQWRYVSAQFYNPVATGGSQSRTISIVLTDVNGNTRTYSVAGTTVTSPFNTAQWIQILGEIEVPTSESGTFDVYNVASLRLKLVDGGNKAGTLYWDDVKFIGSQTLIERIYVAANGSFQLILNPVELFSAGEVLGLLYKNNDVAAKEFTATAKGVLR